MISYGNNISASDHKSQINYFVNKEIFDKVVEKEKIFLPQTEGKIKLYNCQLNIIAYYSILQFQSYHFMHMLFSLSIT